MKALHVPCPVCRAKPGERCRTIAGAEMPESHFKRKLTALFEGWHQPKGGSGNQPTDSV